MGFLDDLGKKVTDAGQKTLMKTKEVSESVKISTLISEEEKKIKDICLRIGMMYVEKYGNECEETFRKEVETVLESKQAIQEYQSQIQDIKGIQICEKCGAKVSRGFAFCNVCGAELSMAVPANNLIPCSGCGAMMKKGTSFCTECGKQLQEAEDK